LVLLLLLGGFHQWSRRFAHRYTLDPVTG
jgi:hypothetical protein